MRVSGLFLLLSLGIGIVPNGTCPGCITPYCLFKDAPKNMECSCCCPSKAPATTGAQMKDGKKCCFLLPLVVHSSHVAVPTFAVVDHGPEILPVAADGMLPQRDDKPELHLTGPPEHGLFLSNHAFLI